MVGDAPKVLDALSSGNHGSQPDGRWAAKSDVWSDAGIGAMRQPRAWRRSEDVDAIAEATVC
jgi:hypothetical protein